jgi:hypothetical protein
MCVKHYQLNCHLNMLVSLPFLLLYNINLNTPLSEIIYSLNLILVYWNNDYWKLFSISTEQHPKHHSITYLASYCWISVEKEENIWFIVMFWYNLMIKFNNFVLFIYDLINWIQIFLVFVTVHIVTFWLNNTFRTCWD